MSDQEPALEAGAVAEADVLDSEDAGNKVIRGGGVRVLSYVAGLLIGLVSAPLLVRHLSIADFGVYATVTSITFVVGGLVEGGLGNVAIRGYATAGPQERVRLLDALLGLRFVLATVGVLLALGFTVIAGYRWEVTAGVAISGVGLLVGAWQNTLAVALQAGLKLGSLAGADMARQLASTVVIIALVIAGAAVVPFFIASPVAFVAMLAATLYAGRGAVRLRPAADVARWRALIRETSLYAIATALGVLYFQIAIISTSLLSTSDEAGYYGAAFRIVDIANGVPWLLASSAFPILARAAHNDADRLRYATDRLYQTALVVGGVFCVAIAVGAPFGLEVVGGHKLDPAIPTLRLLGFGVPFTFLVATWAFTLLSLHAHKGLLAANAVAVVVALALSLALIPDHGARGAAITTMVLEVVLAASYAIALTRARPDLRPTLGILPRVGVALGGALAAGFLLPLPVVPATLVAVAVYLALAFATRAVPEEIAIALRERLVRRP
ncbi:MAG: oligosaccharide flippase family protein [Conexibacter sp.]|nr:oligosaccharide flippase family protein [Conexibacter sp.]